MPASTHSTAPSPTDSSPREKERDLELQAASPADLAASQAVPDPAHPTKEYLTDVHEIPKNNLWLVFTGVSPPVWLWRVGAMAGARPPVSGRARPGPASQETRLTRIHRPVQLILTTALASMDQTIVSTALVCPALFD